MRSHTLAPFTRLTSIKRIFKWTKVEQETFNEIKRIVARDTLLTYPHFNKTFKIQGPSQDVPFNLIIWYISKTIPTL